MRNKLTATQVKKLPPEATASDGGGLRIGRNRSGSLWYQYRYRLNDKYHSIGCGGDNTSLAEARKKRDQFEEMVQRGENPKIKKTVVEVKVRMETAGNDDGPTFGAIFEQFWDDVQRDTLNNDRDRKYWRNGVYQYLEPLMSRPLDAITIRDVADVVRPYWTTKHETIEKTLRKASQAHAYALVPGVVRNANPFEKKLVATQLPTVTAKERHHEAIDFTYAPELYKRIGTALRTGTMSATHLGVIQMTLFSALRFANSGGMQWDWVDEGNGALVIPAEHMKGRKEGDDPFRQVITEPMQQVLDDRRIYNAERHSTNPLAEPWVFPQEFRQRKDGQWTYIADQPVCQALKKINPDPENTSPTMHGLRTTFREWCSENDVPDEVAERCLDHQDKNKVRRAYLRSDLWSKRQRVMDDWSRYLQGKKS